MAKKTEIANILKIDTLFEKNDWTSREEYEDVYNRFCQLSRSFNEDEVDLILELSQRYLWISYNDYNSKLRKLLKNLKIEHLEDVNKIYAFPIIKPCDEDKNKSGHNVMYMLSGLKASLIEYDDINYEQRNKFNSFEREFFSLESNEIIVLVDDYVGTGSTLNETIDEIKRQNNEITNKNFVVLSIAMQNETHKNLENIGIKCCVSVIIKKGITEYYTGEQLIEKVEVMKKIENYIPKIKGYRMGYKKSESLITLIKTPNNTFPIFWKNFTKRNIEFKAPFSRF
jgi:hypothetical protein